MMKTPQSSGLGYFTYSTPVTARFRPPTHNQGPYDTALKCASNFTPLKLGASFWRLSTSRKALDARLSTHG